MGRRGLERGRGGGRRGGRGGGRRGACGGRRGWRGGLRDEGEVGQETLSHRKRCQHVGTIQRDYRIWGEESTGCKDAKARAVRNRSKAMDREEASRAEEEKGRAHEERQGK